MYVRDAFRVVYALLAVTVTATACGSDGSSGATSSDSGTSSGGASPSGAGASNGGATSSSGGSTSSSGGSVSTSGGVSSSSGGRASSSGGASTSNGGSVTGGAANGGASTSNGGTAGSAGAGGVGHGGATTANCSGATDACPMSTGLEYACEKRFALGLNYAWHNFAGDFGGISAFGQKGVSQDMKTYDDDLHSMRMMGASAIRWWVFPDFRGNGVTFDGNGDPSGVTPLAVADIGAALSLAKSNGLYLVLTIFSFDDFRPDHTDSGIMIRGMSAMVSSPARRAKLVANVVTPLARAVAGHPAADRLLGWDIINEPEWAVTATGNAPGGQDFTPNTELTTVSLADMKALITESRAALEKETPAALTTVGWAAAKWHWAFSDVALDFDEPHIYGWVDKYWPYTKSPSALGYTSRPVVMGEFFLASMPFSDGGDQATIAQVLEGFWSEGYSGAWPWQYNEHPGSTLIQSFAMSKGCAASF